MLIRLYASSGHAEKAMDLLREMESMGFQPDKACACLEFLFLDFRAGYVLSISLLFDGKPYVSPFWGNLKA